MSVATEPSLETQRHELRIRLQTQRREIARQLRSGSGTSMVFPRSKTMRLLTQRPQLLYRVVGGLFGLLRLR